MSLFFSTIYSLKRNALRGAFSLLLVNTVILLAMVAAFGQAFGEAVDDFYVIDGQQYINVAENDNPRNQLWIIDPALRGTVATCAAAGCPAGTLLYTPPGSGYDKFRYCWGQLDPTGSFIQCYVRIATVTLLATGDGSQDFGSCPIEKPGPSAPPPPSSVGQPVNVTNGNMWLEQSDYSLPGIGEPIRIDRFYNSQRQSAGLFGFGWSTEYDESLTIYDLGMVRLNLPDGKGAFFGRPNSGVPFASFTPDVVGQIVKEADNTYTLTFHDGRIHKFDTSGKLLWLRDRNGNQTTLGYISGQLTSVTDPVNRTLNLTPNANGTIAQMADTLGVVASYEYYPSTSLLKTVTYADGSKYKFEYDTTSSAGKTLLSTVKDALDNILETHLYDSQGRATTSEKHGGIDKYTLDYSNSGLPSGASTSVTDGLGRVTSYHFQKKNGKKLITQTVGSCSCGSGGSETTNFEYDYKSNLIKKTDALGHETTYAYDANRNLTQATDPLGVQKWTYNTRGQVLSYKDRVDQSTANNTVANTYDTDGDWLTTTDRLGHTTTLTYTVAGQFATVTDARNKTTAFTYDTQGRLIEVTDANNKVTNFGYDQRARVTSVTNALSQTTTIDYDLNNRLKKITFPDTNYVQHTYDLAGRRSATRDARGNSTTYDYDNAYRLTSVTDPLGHAKTFGYDLMSNLTSQTDALGNTTNLDYDDFDRLKKIVYPPASKGATQLEKTITYDKLGNIKTRVDTAGRTTSYDYDTSNRLIKITDADNKLTQFEYSLRSHLEKVKDPLNQEYVFTYDPLGRKLSETRAGTTMSYLYDAVGNRTKRTDHNGTVTNYTYDNLNRLTSGSLGTYTYDDLSRMLTATNYYGTVSFTYDSRGRVDTTTDVYGKVLDYDYDENGNRMLMKLDGSSHTGYTYDAANRLSTITNVPESATTTYSYNLADKLLSKALPNGVTTTYAYDGMSRLTRLKDEGTTVISDRQYTFNTANQIASITEPTRTRSFTYDNVDRLTGATDTLFGNESYAYDAAGNRTSSHRSSTYSHNSFNRLASTNSASYTYDNNGAMTSRTDGNGTLNFSHDSEGRLLNAYRFDGAMGFEFAEYHYDALGRRISKSEPYDLPSEYTYDGNNLLVSSWGGMVTKYVNGPGIDNPLSVQVAGSSSWSYPLADHLGTLGATDSFGNGGYRFTGREYDNFTELYYYRARMYDPQLGRFTAEDPIGFRGGVNWFAYTKNDPVNYIDPFGLSPENCTSCPGNGRPKLWDKPQFESGPYADPNPLTTMEKGDISNFWEDPWGTVVNAVPYYCYNFGLKGLFGDLGPRGTGLFGRSMGGVPGGPEMINTLEMGPDLYNTLDTVDRRNQDYNDAIRCASGNCSTSPYARGNGLGGTNNGWPSPPGN